VVPSPQSACLNWLNYSGILDGQPTTCELPRSVGGMRFHMLLDCGWRRGLQERSTRDALSEQRPPYIVVVDGRGIVYIDGIL
jgi:hypothetical protein